MFACSMRRSYSWIRGRSRMTHKTYRSLKGDLRLEIRDRQSPVSSRKPKVVFLTVPNPNRLCRCRYSWPLSNRTLYEDLLPIYPRHPYIHSDFCINHRAFASPHGGHCLQPLACSRQFVLRQVSTQFVSFSVSYSCHPLGLIPIACAAVFAVTVSPTAIVFSVLVLFPIAPQLVALLLAGATSAHLGRYTELTIRGREPARRDLLVVENEQSYLSLIVFIHYP